MPDSDHPPAELIAQMSSQLDSIKRTNEKNNIDYWRARDLMGNLGYDTWENFHVVLLRAVDACTMSGQKSSQHFRETTKLVPIGSGATRNVLDYFVTKYAAYLIAMNGNPQKPEIAVAQTYFAVQTHRQEVYEQSTEEDRRIELRDRVKTNNRQLSATAIDAGVASQRLGIFHGSGYQGLYGGRDLAAIKAEKGLKNSEDLLDRSGPTELALNDFRITQTKEKIRNQKITGESAAIQTHRTVGLEVRNAIAKIGGTMPEKLRPEPSIKKIESARKKREKLAAKEKVKSLPPAADSLQ